MDEWIDIQTDKWKEKQTRGRTSRQKDRRTDPNS